MSSRPTRVFSPTFNYHLNTSVLWQLVTIAVKLRSKYELCLDLWFNFRYGTLIRIKKSEQ